MISKKQKYYVVWKGRKRGIYSTWEECKNQVDKFTGARYKSFPTKAEAEAAFKQGWTGTNKRSTSSSKDQAGSVQTNDYILESISVDAACSGNPGKMEYRGVYTKDGKEIFHHGPVDHGTNNIGEFLAIVHALALLKERKSDMPIYSDSEIAIGWVRKKQMNTTIPRNADTESLWNVIERAVKWLQNNDYRNPIIKWDTAKWGEIKADFGRK